MVMDPEKIAAAPTPAIARPMISIIEDDAAAQMTEPTVTGQINAHSCATYSHSKTTKAARYTHLMSKYCMTLPKVGCKAVVVIKYAAPYQPTSSVARNSVVILGIAVAIIYRQSAKSMRDGNKTHSVV